MPHKLSEEWWQRITPRSMVWHKRGEFQGATDQVWGLCGAWEWKDNVVTSNEAPQLPALWCGKCWEKEHNAPQTE